MNKIYSIILTVLFLATNVSAITVVNITRMDTIGLSLERGDIIILSEDAMEMQDNYKGRMLGSHVKKVYICEDKSCVDGVVMKYKKRYKTQGLCYIDWR